MSLILNKGEVRQTLRQMIQEASQIAKAANKLDNKMIVFKSDGTIRGDGFSSAKNHFGVTYHRALMLTIKTCEDIKSSAEKLLNNLDKPFVLDREVMKEEDLLNHLETLGRNAARYQEHINNGEDTDGTYADLLAATNRDIKDYKKTIEQMHQRNANTKNYFNNARTTIGRLSAAVTSIKTGYNIEYKDGKPVATFKNTIAGIDEAETVALESKYKDPDTMKAKFDPVNMATGCYIYDKSFLKTEGVVPLAFELHYSSTNPNDYALSKGWGHNQDIRLEETEEQINLKLRAERTETYLKKGNEIVNADGFSGRRLERAEGEGAAYIYTDEDGIKYFFDATGQCIETINSEGFSIHYGYEDEKLSSVDTDFGTGYSLRYNEKRLIEVSDLAGRRIKFSYEEDKLLSVIDECGEEYKYEYDDFGRMHRVINARGTVNLVNTYDSLGRVLKQDFLYSHSPHFRYRYLQPQSLQLFLYKQCSQHMLILMNKPLLD